MPRLAEGSTSTMLCSRHGAAQGRPVQQDSGMLFARDMQMILAIGATFPS
jgi:hypothetical protein